jgi:hypothetical protein
MLSTLHTRLRAHRAPGIPRALFSEGAGPKSKPRAKNVLRDREGMAHRHCDPLAPRNDVSG